MDFGRNSTPVRRAAAEKSTATTISPEGYDSGYNSTGNTTDHSQDFADGVALPSRSFFERKVKKLRLFDKEIPRLTQQRFDELHELFGGALYEHLIKAKVNPISISLKLKVLGETEATAKPWIVVLCNQTASKKIRQFFNKQHIKANYQPPDPDLPSFEVFICNRPPRPMASTDIYGDHDERSTMCGKIIKVGEAHQSRFATLGGMIKIINPSGTIRLCGMTAGHILAQQPLAQDSLDLVDVHDEEDEEDEGYDSGEEEYELDDAVEGDEVAQELVTTGGREGSVPQSTQLGLMWPKIGNVYAASNVGAKMGHDLDWALVDLDKVTEYRPNLLVDGEEPARNRPLKENGKSTEDGSSRPVCLLSGTGGVKSATLSTSLSFLMMGPAKAFTKTYTLILPHGSVLNAGDCGSWVVDPSTYEVYGHVVASDAMGDSYVVPLNAILRDMEEKLGATVSLPTEADVHTWLAQHTKSAAEQVIVTANNKKKKVVFNDSKINNLQKPAGHRLSTASVVETSTSIVDYCSICNAEFKGTSQDVRSSLLRHQRICSKENKDAARRTESPNSHDVKKSLDKSPTTSSVNYAKKLRQTALDQTSAQQTNPVPWSIRSMYSSFRQKSGSDSQQKDGNRGKGVSSSKDKKPAESVSSMKPAITTSSTSTAKQIKTNTKKSIPKKDSASPPIGKGFPAPSPPLAGRTSRDLPPAPIQGRRSSLPTATPLLPHSPEYGRITAPTPPSPPPAPRRIHESSYGSRAQSYHNHSGQVSYEGYTFTKCDSHQTGQKETWAVARMLPMPVSQEDLKDQIKKNRKKHSSALDQYNDEKMKGFKRKQVDNLIRERTKIDGDYGYEYVLASIKLDSRKSMNKMETVSMQVILKRQQVAGFPHEPSASLSMDFHPKLPSQVMDLTSGDELGNFRGYGGGSHDIGHGVAIVPFAGYPQQTAYPVSPAHGQYFSHGVQHVDNRPPLYYPAPQPLDPIHSPVQAMRRPPHPHSVPLVHQEIHDAQRHLENANKSNQKKKAPKVDDKRHESRKKPHYPSDSSSHSDISFGFVSDNSLTKTDVTPDTVISGESSEYRKERKYQKESKERSHSRDKIDKMPSTYETQRPLYREHRRKEPRRSSISPGRESRDLSPKGSDLGLERHGWRPASPRRSYGTHYRDHGHYDIEPAVSFPTNRAHRQQRSSALPEGPSLRRASSYEHARPLTQDSRALVPIYHRPIIYRETSRDFSRAIDPYDYTVERQRDRERWERERLQRSREEAEGWARRADRAREMAMRRETERRRSENIERERWRRGTTRDDDHMPRYGRESDYYYG